MLDMIAGYMEAGFLENIVDMFKSDPALFKHLPGLVADERGRVRLGAAALVEELLPAYRADIERTVGSIARVALTNENPAIRGDAAYLLELIGGEAATAALRAALGAEADPAVREAIMDALKDDDTAAAT